MFLIKLFILLLLIGFMPAYAENLDNTTDDVRANEVRIAAEIEWKKQEVLRLKRIKKREGQARALQKKIIKVDAVILRINDDMDILKGEIALLNLKEKKARKRLRSKLESFNETALTIARLERMPVEAMAAASSMRAAHIRKGVVESGRKSLSGDIHQNRQDIYELQDIRSQRNDKIKETTALQNKRLSEKKRLEKLFNKQIKWLAADDAQKAMLLKKAHQMKQKKSLLSLLKGYKKTQAYLPKSASGLKVFPVQGHIIRSYNEKDKNGVKSHGVTIACTASEPVTAVKNGRVIYSDDFREYGYIVILEHADGSNSLYSGMEKSNKKVGDFIYAGKMIGRMPPLEKPELYLEIRQEGQTINPALYLSQIKASS